MGPFFNQLNFPTVFVGSISLCLAIYCARLLVGDLAKNCSRRYEKVKELKSGSKNFLGWRIASQKAGGKT